MINKAIAVYVDNSQKILTEFSWLYKTWRLYSLDKEFDLIVYHHPLIKEKLNIYESIIKIEMPNIRISDTYKFLNSHYFCLDEWSEPLKKYKYLFKTDCDVFLTEHLKGFTPSKFMVGQGGYYNQSDEKKINYIKYLSKKLNLNYNNLSGIGASFFGKTDQVLSVVKKQIIFTELILKEDSKTEEFKESGFNIGISSMIGGELAINDCFCNQHVTLYTLDNKCWESIKIGKDVIHIHAWHTDSKWSKHSFFNGEYKNWIILEKDAFLNASNYCQWISSINLNEVEKFRKLYENNELIINYDF